jgi:hypothetical protein
MERRSFIRRLTAGVMASSMLWEALTRQVQPDTATEASERLQYVQKEFKVGFRVSKELLEDTSYSGYINKNQIRDIMESLEAHYGPTT